MITTTITRLTPVAAEALDLLSVVTGILPGTPEPMMSRTRTYADFTPADLHTAIRTAMSEYGIHSDYRDALDSVLSKLAYYITSADLARERSSSWDETADVRNFGHVTMNPHAHIAQTTH